MGGGSLRRFQILISSSVIEFLLILGAPHGDGGWIDRVWNGGGCPQICDMHMCMHMRHHRESQGFPEWPGRHLQLQLSC